MKFNMGCGRRKLAGYINVDASEQCDPDQVIDLERTPWPWPSDVATEVRFIHSLEPLGGDPKVFLAMMQELYRVASDGCEIVIHVPHPRHDNFLGDPTHVRPITEQLLSLFDRSLNDAWKEAGGANTPLAHYTGVDFEIVSRRIILDEPYFGQLQRGEVSEAEMARLVRTHNNIARELQFVLRARKS